MKNGVAKEFAPFRAVNGGNVKNAVKSQVLVVLVSLGAGLWMAGCKSSPDLTQAQALTMIQAKYGASEHYCERYRDAAGRDCKILDRNQEISKRLLG
jgi:hypothetical protein